MPVTVGNEKRDKGGGLDSVAVADQGRRRGVIADCRMC